jgi:WhiB family redox-sensing transcriptional regulator
MLARANKSAGSTPRVAEAWMWQLAARCRGEDPALFFPPDRERGHDRGIRETRAKALCERCPVTAKCLEHSMKFPEYFGIWGGLSEDQRTRMLNLRPRRVPRWDEAR